MLMDSWVLVHRYDGFRGWWAIAPRTFFQRLLQNDLTWAPAIQNLQFLIYEFLLHASLYKRLKKILSFLQAKSSIRVIQKKLPKPETLS